MPSTINKHWQNKCCHIIIGLHPVSRKVETGRKGVGAHQQEVEHEGFVSELPVVQMTAGLPRCWGPTDP